MSNSNYDPQTLDHYEPFHKEFGKKEYLTMGAYTAIFAPFGWFIARSPDKRVRLLSTCALACLGCYCGHCVAVTSTRERIEKRRWEKYHC